MALTKNACSNQKTLYGETLFHIISGSFAHAHVSAKTSKTVFASKKEILLHLLLVRVNRKTFGKPILKLHMLSCLKLYPYTLSYLSVFPR